MRSLGHNVCVLVRWAILTVSLSTLLFLAAGTTQVLALWTYMAAMSTLLLVTMLAVDPKLAEERVHPGMGTIDPGIRIAASCLFLLTLTTAAVDVGRLHTSHNMPAGLRFVALILFTLSGSLQAWAMALNPFFSPGVRLQKERGHHVIDRGPYGYLRHPGYLAMLISIPTTAVAIGSWLALVPATGFAGHGCSPPNYMLNTSPGKYQVVWNVRGISQENSEALLRGLVETFGSDSAATDSTRVFRFPGFSNKKYENDLQETAEREAPLSRVYQASDFDLDIPAQGGQSMAFTPRSAEPLRDREETSQSERDWAYAIRHLKRGDDPDQIIREIAAYRGVDRFDKADLAKLIAPKKPSPQYYAERTVTQAMTHLGMSRSARTASGAVAPPGHRRADSVRRRSFRENV